MKNSFFKKISIFVFFLVAVFLLFNGNNINAYSISKNPVGIAVTYYYDIDSRGFAWQTSTDVTESNLLVVKDEGKEVNWDIVTPIKGKYDDLNGFRCHRAQITDLEAGSYLYKVGSTGNYSDVGKFVVDNSNDNKLSFTYVTDSQEVSVEGFEQFNKTLNTAVKYEPNFIAFAGDLVDNSHANWGSDLSKIKMEEWIYCYDTTKGVTMNYPMMSASGNHERAGYSYVYHNNIDYDKAMSTGGYYSFDYENLHFTVLDTNVFEDGIESEIQSQIKWLEEDLASTNKPWKIVMLHIGAYSTGDHSNDSSTVKIRNMLPPIFAKYKVDLVLQGHDHVYSRTMPYYYGEGEDGKVVNRNETYIKEDGINWSLEPDGTYYITINYSGTKSYPPVDYDTSRIFPAKSPVNGKVMSQHIKNRMFAHIEIDGDKLLLKSYLAYDDGSDELYDYIAIKKNTYQTAIDAIEKLDGNLTIKDAYKVKEAKDAYENLSERALRYVPTNVIEKLNNVLASYNLTYNLAALEVISSIGKLDTQEYDEEFLANYKTACELYYNLTNAQKELVDNADILFQTKEKLTEIEETVIRNYLVAGVQRLIDSINTASDKEEARLIAKAAYELLDEEAKALVKNTDLLKEPEAKKGCGGSIAASILSVICLGIVMILSRKRRGDYNEEN